MLLKNSDIIHVGNADIHVVENRIEDIFPGGENPVHDEQEIDCNETIVFPGLINSHDHLEFNLFPQLGNYHYKNYVEWGEDIHKVNKEVINSVLKIPKDLRVLFGVYKNLLNGVTTVVQHGEYFHLQDPVIDVFEDAYSIHSVQLGKKWKWKLNRPFRKDKLYVIHIGEGIDKTSYDEIDQLIRWNFFRHKLIGVHGVAMTEKQADAFEALIWCPASNYFLLNKTAAADKLKSHTKILFGTDSTVSANWNLWEQLRLAKKTGLLTDEELFSALTKTAAAVWGLHDRGRLEKGNVADIVVGRRKQGNNFMDNFFSLQPGDVLLVIKNGAVVLFDESYYFDFRQLPDFSKIRIGGRLKYVKGDLAGLLKQIKNYAPGIALPFSD